MSTAAATFVEPLAPARQPVNYLNTDHSLRSWLLTTDHKRIALLYLVSVSFFFLVGGLFAMGIRFELLTPATDLMSAGLAAFVAGFSSIFTGLNFIVTVHRVRAPGLTWFRLPLFVWSNYAASIIRVLGTPVVAIAIVLIALERLLGVGIFDATRGGDPLLFQHLFWFYSHPAVYVMLLPSMGVISEIISTFSRKRVFGYTAVAFSSVAISVFGFFVWEHHMFIMGVSNYSALVFSLLTMLVAVPSAIKVFNWTFTLHKGSIEFTAPMIYAFCFLGLFVVGGVDGRLSGAILGRDVPHVLHGRHIQCLSTHS